MQDALNLGWKIALVCRGAAPQELLDTYEAGAPVGPQRPPPHRPRVHPSHQLPPGRSRSWASTTGAAPWPGPPLAEQAPEPYDDRRPRRQPLLWATPP
ncbi:FAD-dependent monooxygenase [Streptomyces sp. TRM68367]|uniref:FAD-dependent monooxygenase n=1 Tax=Streptomyces sp. TRM68367 TaxID=2758415 RepID=UPI0037DCEB27